jgi:cellulose synthase/poly-beta-1,6-N-acetylglucosamine synthase-like glycosyltransferase
MKETLHFPPGWGATGMIVAIPARNEAARLPLALAALAREAPRQDAIVIANGCSDATATIARQFTGISVAVLETKSLDGGVGEARRRGLRAALEAAPHAAILATTDADCVVMGGWARIVQRTMETADVVCGRVVPDPGEFALLPDIVRRHGNLEDEVSALQAELEGMRAPNPHDPLPRHGQTPGASLAFRADAYRRAGGFEAISCHEDRRIVARIEASGGRVARPWALVVAASCRLEGRAPGGMADTISKRMVDQTHLRSEIVHLRRQAIHLRRAIAFHRDARCDGTVSHGQAKALVYSRPIGHSPHPYERPWQAQA